MNATSQIEASELGAAAHDHLDAGVAETDAVSQVEVLQLEEELRPVGRNHTASQRRTGQHVGTAARVDARDLRTTCNRN